MASVNGARGCPLPRNKMPVPFSLRLAPFRPRPRLGARHHIRAVAGTNPASAEAVERYVHELGEYPDVSLGSSRGSGKRRSAPHAPTPLGRNRKATTAATQPAPDRPPRSSPARTHLERVRDEHPDPSSVAWGSGVGGLNTLTRPTRRRIPISVQHAPRPCTDIRTYPRVPGRREELRRVDHGSRSTQAA